jgi:hypothetical protein
MKQKIKSLPDGLVPKGYISGVFRGDGGEKRVTHLYKGTFGEHGNPMCKRGWQYGDSYSIFRNNITDKGICKVCLRRAKLGLDGVQ